MRTGTTNSPEASNKPFVFCTSGVQKNGAKGRQRFLPGLKGTVSFVNKLQKFRHADRAHGSMNIIIIILLVPLVQYVPSSALGLNGGSAQCLSPVSCSNLLSKVRKEYIVYHNAAAGSLPCTGRPHLGLVSNLQCGRCPRARARDLGILEFVLCS